MQNSVFRLLSITALPLVNLASPTGLSEFRASDLLSVCSETQSQRRKDWGVQRAWPVRQVLQAQVTRETTTSLLLIYDRPS